MNLAIEYIYRSYDPIDLLEFPCSLFLEKSTGNEKKIITLKRRYGNYITIAEWEPDKANIHMIPGNPIATVHKSELHNNSGIIVEGYWPLRFKCVPYKTGKRQRPDPPMSISQEIAFNSCLQMFYNPQRHQETRLEWLWKSFFPVAKKEFPELFTESAHIMNYHKFYVKVVRKNHKDIWKYWAKWTKSMFAERNTQFASELLFETYYKKKFGERQINVADFTFCTSGYTLSPTYTYYIS